MQDHYNLLYREEEREMLKFCNETGVGVIPVSSRLDQYFPPESDGIQYSPLSRGSLARPLEMFGTTLRSSQPDGDPCYKTGHTDAEKEIIKRVQEIADKKGWTMAQVALSWLMQRVTSPTVGLNSINRMKEAAAASRKAFTQEEQTYLEEPYIPVQIQGHV